MSIRRYAKRTPSTWTRQFGLPDVSRLEGDGVDTVNYSTATTGRPRRNIAQLVLAGRIPTRVDGRIEIGARDTAT